MRTRVLQPPQLPVTGEIISFLWWSTNGHATEVYLFVRIACTTVNPKLYLTHDEYKQFANYLKSFLGHNLLIQLIQTAQIDANKHIHWILSDQCVIPVSVCWHQPVLVFAD